MMEKFKIGDIVKPMPECIGNKDIFRIVSCNDNNKYNLKQLTSNGMELSRGELENWTYDLLQAVPSITNPMDVVTQQVLADIKTTPLYIDSIQNQIKAYEEMLSKEGENNMKLLEIYKKMQLEKIDKKYRELIEKERENDNIHKIIKDAENKINVLLNKNDKDERICLGGYHLLEANTSKAISVLQSKQAKEEDDFIAFMEEVNARLELCDNSEESKINVLKKYGILDSEGRIKKEQEKPSISIPAIKRGRRPNKK